jgi:hypothetical protein
MKEIIVACENCITKLYETHNVSFRDDKTGTSHRA